MRNETERNLTRQETVQTMPEQQLRLQQLLPVQDARSTAGIACLQQEELPIIPSPAKLHHLVRRRLGSPWQCNTSTRSARDRGRYSAEVSAPREQICRRLGDGRGER